MNLQLEDLTKEELIKLMRNRMCYLPTQRDMLNARWETMTEESQRIMAQAIEESKKYEGIKTMEAVKSWNDAQTLFDKGLKLSEKADALFKELCETKE